MELSKQQVKLISITKNEKILAIAYRLPQPEGSGRRHNRTWSYKYFLKRILMFNQVKFAKQLFSCYLSCRKKACMSTARETRSGAVVEVEIFDQNDPK